MRLPGLAALALLLACASTAAAQPALVHDLAEVSTASGELRRVYGSVGNGASGVPVAGGLDVDGDGFRDYAFAAMRAAPMGVANAGQTFLVFGDGTLSGTIDTVGSDPGVLKLEGSIPNENAGSEIWMAEVTGDAYGDLLIARQNYTLDFGGPGEREGAGALTIVVGGPELRSFAATLQRLDLESPPPGITLFTLVGPHEFARTGIWMRAADVDGDGVDDLVLGSDQEDGVATHSGAVYVVRGGAHLAASQTLDLATFASSGLADHVAKLLPPTTPNPSHFHFGATVQAADLDGNGAAEVLAAAALNRAGAALNSAGGFGGTAHATGGSPHGSVYIAWDESFGAGPWGFTSEIDQLASYSIIEGGLSNLEFGEEMLGGLDYDADGKPDLFVGDITGDLSGQSRFQSGAGHVLYDAAKLEGLVLRVDQAGAQVPPIATTTFYGAAVGYIAADTAAHGDFNGDGIDDLAFSSPHASPLGRSSAGTIHVFSGRSGPWPAVIDLAAPPAYPAVLLTEIHGANGGSGSDSGDTLCYSAAAGDLDGDGRIDLISNEMQGNGIGPSTEDVGNLVLLSGALLGISVPIPAVPSRGLVALGLGLLLATAWRLGSRAMPRR